MVKLSDRQFAGLIDEIACALASELPVEAAMRRLQKRRMGRVGTAAGRIADRLERGQSIEDAVGEVASPMTAQVSAAIEASGRGGDVRMVSRLAQQLRRRDRFAGATRIAYFYPLLLAVIAYVTTIKVVVPLVLKNEGRDFQWSPWLVAMCGWLNQNVWMVPIVAGLLGLLIWGALRARNALPRHSRLSLFFYSLADQIMNDVPEEEAIQRAAKLSGDAALQSIKHPSLSASAIAKLIGQSSELADIDGDELALSFSLNDSASSSTALREPSILVARLYYLGARHAESSRRRAYFWSQLMPRVAMVVVGCGFVFTYAWWVIGPVYREVAQW
ncbi:type II secretion system F family protein [Rubripirellula reticaptiva]|uniref:Bacterial type II secretion system protein F domain protein n=1 Tax=Rubripirellula reticaptiva TaxID=2528013 RepID=A0A5C6ENN4_9BACT|nr:type II secretion system F family protein [Rubripirellula reticaptiva]TWU51363.1 Bacterial type II secretion system protein F domain protein [Rubripirellula reticaptiva]